MCAKANLIINLSDGLTGSDIFMFYAGITSRH